MRDPYLSAIVDAVERDRDAVSISLALTSGAVLSGYLRESHFFVRMTGKEFDGRVANAAPHGHKPSSPAARHAAALAAQAERVKSIYARVEDSAHEPGFITLSDASMVWSNGDGLSLPTVRVSLDAIAAWWVLPGQPIQGKKDASGFWAVGVAF